jgi:hypothetical protein
MGEQQIISHRQFGSDQIVGEAQVLRNKDGFSESSLVSGDPGREVTEKRGGLNRSMQHHLM